MNTKPSADVISPVAALFALVTDFFLMAWLAQVSWNKVLPALTHHQVAKMSFADALFVRTFVYCVVNSFFVNILVSNALRAYCDKWFCMVDSRLVAARDSEIAPVLSNPL